MYNVTNTNYNIGTIKRTNAIPAFIVFALYSLFSQYQLLTLFSGAVFVLIVNLLFKPYVPPVLMYLFGFHWAQIFSSILYVDFVGLSFEQAFSSKDVETLYVFTMLQVATMVLLLSKVYTIRFTPSIEMMREAADKLNIKKILYVYLIASIIFPTLIAATYTSSSISQLVQSFAVTRKMLLLMLIFIAFLKNTKYNKLIALIVVAEFILSFASFFSNFKEVIFFVIFVYLTVKPEIKQRQIVRLVPVAGLLISFMIFWSSVKDGYRSFLNGGTRQQHFTVSRTDALDYLANKAGEFSLDSFRNGGEILLHRVQYMEQYSAVYTRVPRYIPHTNGENLFGTMKFLLIPRIFMDEKKILDPSTKTSYYTGKSFANAEQGTSISMGYFCDLYIDYGLWMMFIPLLIITYGIALVSNYIINSDKYNTIFTYSLFIGTILSLGTFESDIIYYLGIIRNYAVFMLLGNYFLFPWLNKYLKN